ncbi:hypothetical protein D1AOALGA4SA_4098 [Olavius algarvensis Delta 1 endosymbiont]|nr:hypothetical protein D1AOALGA4SA_4098 [Olavius algarvensis Delta 1 endosymbiont]
MNCSLYPIILSSKEFLTSFHPPRFAYHFPRQPRTLNLEP